MTTPLNFISLLGDDLVRLVRRPEFRTVAAGYPEVVWPARLRVPIAQAADRNPFISNENRSNRTVSGGVYLTQSLKNSY